MTKTPVLTHTRADLAAALADLDGTVALVMTMGALHQGHLQLVREGQALADHVVVTIFVNPTQFAPGEDFDAYPRTLDADMEALTRVGADVVWAPPVDEVYPRPATVVIDPGPVARHLEGASRPTHFAGVALVVTKVLNLVRPDVALFGEKDAQQLAVIRSVAEDLDLGVRIVGVPIVRDTDGVALSSRNEYLSADERARARSLSRALAAGIRAAAALGHGTDEAAHLSAASATNGRGVGQVLEAARAVLVAAAGEADGGEPGVRIDYVALVDDRTFEPRAIVMSNTAPVEVLRADALEGAELQQFGRLLIAARVGTTRLIDNAKLSQSLENELGIADNGRHS